jgi:hypothetical protein
MRDVNHELKGERVQEPEAVLVPMTPRTALKGERVQVIIDLTPAQVILTVHGQTQTQNENGLAPATVIG